MNRGKGSHNITVPSDYAFIYPEHLDPGPLELGAIYNTVCTRCGGKGHISSECYNTKGEKYDLLPLDEEPSQSHTSHVSVDSHGSRGRGRGRSATLPAWMTSGQDQSSRSLGGGINLDDSLSRTEDARRKSSPKRKRSPSPRRGSRRSRSRERSLSQRDTRRSISPHRSDRNHSRDSESKSHKSKRKRSRSSSTSDSEGSREKTKKHKKKYSHKKEKKSKREKRKTKES